MPALYPRKALVMFVIAAAFVMIGGIPHYYSEKLALSPSGTNTFLEIIAVPYKAVVGSSPLVLLVCVVLLFFSKRRMKASLTMIFCLVLLFGHVFVWGGSLHQTQQAAFLELTQNGAPLIKAINDYTQKHGKSPRKLDALVPEFLPKVPGTGIGKSLEFQYFHDGDESSLRHEKNPWALMVPMKGFLGSWSLVYLPNQNYPAYGDDNPVERIGDWAYIDHIYIYF